MREFFLRIKGFDLDWPWKLLKKQLEFPQLMRCEFMKFVNSIHWKLYISFKFNHLPILTREKESIFQMSQCDRFWSQMTLDDHKSQYLEIIYQPDNLPQGPIFEDEVTFTSSKMLFTRFSNFERHYKIWIRHVITFFTIFSMCEIIDRLFQEIFCGLANITKHHQARDFLLNSLSARMCWLVLNDTTVSLLTSVW